MKNFEDLINEENIQLEEAGGKIRVFSQCNMRDKFYGCGPEKKDWQGFYYEFPAKYKLLVAYILNDQSGLFNDCASQKKAFKNLLNWKEKTAIAHLEVQ